MCAPYGDSWHFAIIHGSDVKSPLQFSVGCGTVTMSENKVPVVGLEIKEY